MTDKTTIYTEAQIADADGQWIDTIRGRILMTLAVHFQFFSQLIPRVQIYEHYNPIDIAHTNCIDRIYVNPIRWINEFSHGMRVFLMIHEVCHILLAHNRKMQYNLPEEFTEEEYEVERSLYYFAKDQVVHEWMLTKFDVLRHNNPAICEMPKGIFYESRLNGKSVEEVYALLSARPSSEKIDLIAAHPLSLSLADENIPGDLQLHESKLRWEQYVDSAIRFIEVNMSPRERMQMRDFLKFLIRARTGLDYKTLVESILADQAKNDYSMARPNRTWMQYGVIMPTMVGSTIEVAVGIDISYSQSAEAIVETLEEIEAIIATFQTYVIHLFVFADVIEEYVRLETGQNIRSAFDVKKLTEQRSGGTNFKSIYDRLEKMEINEKLDMLLIVTDARGIMPDKTQEGSFKTIWLLDGSCNAKSYQPSVPFGQVIHRNSLNIS